MNRFRADVAAFLAGTIAGAVVLGVGGRVAMSAMAFFHGESPSFSWGGSFEVVLLGAIYGAVGGVLLAVLRRYWKSRGATLGVVLGLVLVAFAWATSSVGRGIALSDPKKTLPIALVSAAMFLAYGLLAEALVRRSRHAAD